MKVALIAYDFYPETGGIANVLTTLYKKIHAKSQNLYVFNPYYQDTNIFNFLDIKEYNLKDLIIILKEKKLLKYLLLSLYKIFQDNKINFFNRLTIATYLFLKPNILIETLRSIKQIYPVLKKLDIDIILGGSSSSRSLTLTYLLSILFDKIVASIAYGDDFLIRKPFSVKPIFINRVKKVLIISNYSNRLMRKIYSLKKDKVVTVNIGLDLNEYNVSLSKEELRRSFNISNDQFVLLSVGRHVSRKKFDLVIKAVKRIKDLNPIIDIKYFLIGDGPLTSNLKKLSEDLNLNNQVEFLGRVDKVKRNQFYKLSDVFLMPSITEENSLEGFGIVFLEANYHYVPVIGTFSGGIVEAIVNGKTGLLVKPNNIDDLIEKIMFLYENKEARQKMGEEGYKRVIKEYNWDKIVEDYINNLKQILE